MNAQIIKNRLRKIFAYLITGLVFILLSSFLLLQAPPVQQHIINRFLRDINQVTGFTTSIKTFRMLWFDRLELEGVLIEDNEKNRMIAVDRLRVNFKLFEMMQGKHINIDGISVESAEVFLKNIAESDSSEDLNINIFINRISEEYGGSGGGGTNPIINIGEAIVQKSKLIYNDGAADSLRGFDYHHFTVDVDGAALNKFVIVGDTVEFNVQSLFAKDQKTGLEVKDFSTFFRISQKAMEFYGLNLKAGESSISDTVVFRYETQRDLSNFNEAVTINAHLLDTYIHPKDLVLFAPEADRLEQLMKVSGDFKGRVNKFQFSNMDLLVGQTRLKGSVSMEGLPHLDETFIELKLTNSTLRFSDLSFALNPTVIGKLQPLGTTTLSGQFLGYVNDFVANGSFITDLGSIKSDINLKINEQNAERSTYSGNIAVVNFELGTYLRDTVNFKQVSITGNIKGSGLSASTADFVLNGKIQSIGVLDYTYQNIITNARFAQEFFSGKIAINDANVVASMEGSIDLRKNINKLQIKGRFDTLNLYKLKLSKDAFFLSTDVSINTQGFTLDSLQGKGALIDLHVTYKEKTMHLDEVLIDAVKNESQRELNVKTDLLEASAKGDFYFSNLFKDFQSLITELNLNIINDSLRTARYYQNSTHDDRAYSVALEVRVKDMVPLTNLLNFNLSISPNVTIEGSFTKGITTGLNMYSFLPRVQYDNFIFENTNVEINTSKLKDSTSVLAMVFIQSERQVIESIATKNLITEAIWDKHHIDFSFDLDQEKLDNNVRLRGTVDFKDSTYMRLNKSTFKLLDNVWKVNENNLLSLKGSELHLQQVGFSNSDQQINIQGYISANETLPLTITLQNIDLQSFESLTTEKFSGLVNADITLRNLYSSTTLENIINISNLTVNDFLVGDIKGKNQWNNQAKRFVIDFMVNRQGIEAINLTGYYDPADAASPLNVNAKLNQANLKLAEPILRGLFSQLDGTLTGDFVIKGTPNKPQIRGTGLVSNGQIMIDYLRTLYKFDGTIGMTPSSLYFENINLVDAYNNKGKLEGFIAHKNFNSMRLNINASFRNFMVLNTTAKDNTLFYGQAFSTGDLNILGPVSNLKISATAKTERNTKLFIPLSGSGTIDKKEFINFVNFRDTTRNNTNQNDNKKTLTGVAVDLNLDITEDAYCEIIFDLKAGDIIRGRGNGDLRLQLDTKGEFNMFGGIVFEEGGYNFTLYNVINKEFEIQKGSQITWSGDPYQGQMNIRAAYNQMASIAPIILDTESQKDPVLRRKYPLQVLLTLDGAMLSPQINFDIIARDLPQSVTLTDGTTRRLAFEFAAFKTKLDEQELKKQVFSLIILRRLSPLNETVSASGSVTNSVSELLSNQLSYWMSQVDENLEIDVDLGALDAEAFNTFQLRLSYTFLNGRLRVTRDGTFTNQNSASAANNPNAGTAALVGDWTVDYLLTADGKFKVRMYNRTNANAILNALNNQNTITTGVSLQHTQTFNTLSDLWRSARARKEEEEEPEPSEEAVLKKDGETRED